MWSSGTSSPAVDVAVSNVGDVKKNGELDQQRVGSDDRLNDGETDQQGVGSDNRENDGHETS